MGKQVKHALPRGVNRATFNSPKTSSHATYRCQRKPNSPLCRTGFTKKTLTNRVLSKMSKKELFNVIEINPVKVNKHIAHTAASGLTAKYAEDKAIHTLEERINDFAG